MKNLVFSPVVSRTHGEQAIQELDFTNLKMKLMQPAPEGKGWSKRKLEEVELWYKRFLILNLLYPNHPHVPNGPIDVFWHYHILDTVKYEEDCMNVFGSFLHHYPYFGLNDDVKARDEAFNQTNLYYRIEFGEDCTAMFGKGKKLNMVSGMNCGSKGSGTGCGQGCRRQ